MSGYRASPSASLDVRNGPLWLISISYVFYILLANTIPPLLNASLPLVNHVSENIPRSPEQLSAFGLARNDEPPTYSCRFSISSGDASAG